MKAGILDRRVLFQSRSPTLDGFGDQGGTWVNVFGGDGKLWASLLPISGKEIFNSEAEQSGVTHEFMVRYRPELSLPKVVAAMRIVWKSRTFNIKWSANFNEGNEYIILRCEEGIAYDGR